MLLPFPSVIFRGGAPEPGTATKMFAWLPIWTSNAMRLPSGDHAGELASQIGTTEYSRPRRFRAMIEQWLDSIRVLWPECPARLTSDGQAITVKHALAVLPTQSA